MAVQFPLHSPDSLAAEELAVLHVLPPAAWDWLTSHWPASLQNKLTHSFYFLKKKRFIIRVTLFEHVHKKGCPGKHGKIHQKMNVLYKSFHGPRNMSGFWSFPLISFLLDLSLSGFANGPQHCMRSARGELSFHRLSGPLTETAFFCASMSQPKSRIVWPLWRLCFRLPQSALPQPPHMMAAEAVIPPVHALPLSLFIFSQFCTPAEGFMPSRHMCRTLF